MNNREQRRQIAGDRRAKWRLHWAVLARQGIQEGLSFEDSLRRAASEANRMIADEPALKSEIMRAFDEFSDVVIAAIKKEKETQP